MKINIDGVEAVVRPMLVTVSVDLAAKHTMLKMTAHNGAYGCISCLEKGEVVLQGRGHTRSYTYRSEGVILRTKEDFIREGQAFTQLNETQRKTEKSVRRPVGKVKCELRVTSCELRVVSCSCFASCEL